MLFETGTVNIHVDEVKDLMITKHFMNQLVDAVEDAEDIDVKTVVSNYTKSLKNHNGELSEYEEGESSYLKLDAKIYTEKGAAYTTMTTNKPHHTYEYEL